MDQDGGAADWLIVDRGYDSNAARALLVWRRIKPIIRTRANELPFPGGL